MHEETNVFEPQKLFYGQEYLKECQAIVEGCEKGKQGYEVILNQTLFFPEGGGQPSDQGFIKRADGTNIPVIDVKEKGEIKHMVELPLEVGEEVTLLLDWERRFDMMQQHSGEHIFSGFVHEKFGFQNVGFHISDGMITIDFDGVATLEDMLGIEQIANRYIWENHETKVFYPSKEELDSIQYRSKMEIAGQVRLVEFPGADLCACCGTHVASSGEVGLIKVISCVNWRGGIRVELVCGRWAMNYFQQIQRQNSAISVQLSAKVFETSKAVERLMNENSQLRTKLASLENKVMLDIAASVKGENEITLIRDDLSGENVRRLCDLILSNIESEEGVCRIFSGNDTEGFRYAMGLKNGDLREFTKKLNTTLCGKGGGKPNFVQGSIQCKKTELEQFLDISVS